MDKELTAANLTAFASELDGLAKAMKVRKTFDLFEIKLNIF